MGFSDKLKGIRDQAQAAVADNKDKIQGAVQSAGEVANDRHTANTPTRSSRLATR